MIRRATLEAGVRLVLALCDELGIPPQIHSRAYARVPLARMEVTSGGRRRQIGGPDCVGIFGHRDNTSHRGQGDPGDAFYAATIAAGAEPFDFSIGQDLAINRLRQAVLNARGERLAVDGLVGSASLAAARRQGFCRWRDVPAQGNLSALA